MAAGCQQARQGWEGSCSPQADPPPGVAPVVAAIAPAVVVLSPFLALPALVFGLSARSGLPRIRSPQLTLFTLI